MKQWFIGTNNYWFTASIFLEKSPFVLMVIERLAMTICNVLIRVGFERVHDLWHINVCSKTTDLLYKHTKSIVIPMPYFYLKEKFPERFEYSYEYNEELVDDNRSVAWKYSNKHKESSRRYEERIDKLMGRMEK